VSVPEFFEFIIIINLFEFC